MSDNSTSGGIGFSSLLQLTFIILKLCKVISWSWWWVLSPTWIGIALVMLILLAMLVIIRLANRNQTRIRRKRIQTMDEYKKSIDDFQKSRWQQRLDEMQRRKP